MTMNALVYEGWIRMNYKRGILSKESYWRHTVSMSIFMGIAL